MRLPPGGDADPHQPAEAIGNGYSIRKTGALAPLAE